MSRSLGSAVWRAPSENDQSPGTATGQPAETRTRELLERRYDAAIPGPVLDAARYPTRPHQVVRARARVAAARAAISGRMAQWRLELARARAGAADCQVLDVAAAAARAVHAPHIRYHLRERKRWSDHLDALLRTMN